MRPSLELFLFYFFPAAKTWRSSRALVPRIDSSLSDAFLHVCNCWAAWGRRKSSLNLDPFQLHPGIRGKGRNGPLGHKKSRLPFKALIIASDAGWPRARDPQELLQRLTGWAVEWAAPIVGPHTPLQALLWCYLISAIPATQSVETWLISVGVCCLLLRLMSLVPQQDDFLARGCTAVGGRTGQRQNRSKTDYYCLLNK